MRKINPNLLKLAEMTHNPSLAELKLEEKLEDIITEVKDIPGYIYVPSIKLYVAEERSILGNNWYGCHKELHKRRQRMLTLHEFVEFLKYLKYNPNDRNNKILNDIIEVRAPLRAEWLDADFKVIKGKLSMNYWHESANGKLKPKYTDELNNYLAEGRRPGIDLDNWLEHATCLGLPPSNCKSGSLFYWAPKSDNNSVAWAGAGSGGIGLDCDRGPSYREDTLGVRAVRYSAHDSAQAQKT